MEKIKEKSSHIVLKHVMTTCSGERVEGRVEEKFIYKITCTKNGRSYIGRTTRPKFRFGEHIEELKNNRHRIELMQEDFNLYGIDSFTYEIIGEDNLGFNFERKMQELFKTYLPEYGYNYKDQNFKKEE